MRINEKCVPSSDGIHTLHGYVYLPDGEPRGVVQIVHGMAEHIERYDDFMKFLASSGFIACGHDHIGHGKSVKSEDELGFFAEKDGWKILIRDVEVFGKAVMADYPDQKHILLGHSMGSFVVRLFAVEYPKSIDGLIIMGTGGPNPAVGAGIALGKMICALKGKKHYSSLLDSMAFGAYNKQTEKRTKFDWLSYDTKNVDRYIEDRFSGFPFTASAMVDLFYLTKNSNTSEWFSKMPKTLPVLLVSGEEDPVGAYCAGVEKVAELLRANNMREVTVYTYEGRHEILQDKCSDFVYADLFNWISAI